MNTAIAETITFVLSAAGSDASAATDVFSWYATEAFELVGIAAQCDDDNPPTGSAAQFDVNKNGTTMLSTKVTIDAGETHSKDAATPPVISVSSVAKNDLLEFDIDQVGSTNAGQEYKVTLTILRAIVGP